MLGQERVKAGLVRRGEHRRLVAEALELLEHPDIRPDAIAGTLERRRAAARRGRTGAGLGCPRDRLRRADELADRARRRAAVRGHRPASVDGGSPSSTSAISSRKCGRIAERYHGAPRRATVASGRMAGTDLGTIIAAMVGRDLTEMFPHVPHTPGEAVLELSGLSGRRLPSVGRLAWSNGVRSSGSPAWSARAGPSCSARSSGSTRSVRGGWSSRGSTRDVSRRPGGGSSRVSGS